MPLLMMTWQPKEPGPRFNIKMTSYWYRKSHCGDKTILRPSYLHNGISYTGKTTSLYWIGAQVIRSHGIDPTCAIYSIVLVRMVNTANPSPTFQGMMTMRSLSWTSTAKKSGSSYVTFGLKSPIKWRKKWTGNWQFIGRPKRGWRHLLKMRRKRVSIFFHDIKSEL